MRSRSTFCFLCLADSTSTGWKPAPSRKGKCKTKEKKVELLVQYFLGNKSESGLAAEDYNEVKREMLKKSKLLELCDKCDLETEVIVQSHLELEAIQMKLMEEISKTRLSIIKESSKHLPEIGGRGFNLDLLNLTKKFQESVEVAARDAIRIPLVYLEKFGCSNVSYILLPEVEQHEAVLNVKLENEVDSETLSDVDVFEDGLPPEIDELPPEATKTSSKSKSKQTGSRVILKKGQGRKKIHKRIACKLCPYSCNHSRRFEQHLQSHETEEKHFHCEKCPTKPGFTTKEFHQFHLDRHKTRVTCKTCSKLFDPFELIEHRKLHVDQVFSCPMCSYFAESVQVITNHILLSHRTTEMESLPCWLCSQTCGSKTELMAHLHNEHQAVEKYTCEVEGCNKSFFRKKTFNGHKLVHANTFQCDICHKHLATKQSLTSHKLLHTGERPFPCDLCNEAFISKESFKLHQRREHGAERIKCNQCGKNYSCKRALLWHLRMEHGAFTKFQCEVCGKKCPSGTTLRIHMDTDHSDARQFVCSTCGKAYKTLAICKSHQKRVHGEKIWKCSFCVKAFSTKEHLAQHERTHTGEEPFLCQKCGKTFRHSKTRNVHRKKCLET